MNASYTFDVEGVRKCFPLLAQEVNGHPLVYLDNAATTQKPRVVLEALENYYRNDNANVHRAVHALAERATESFESARRRVATFINAASHREIIWTRGTTESINLVAASFGGNNLRPGDEIVLSVGSGGQKHRNIERNPEVTLVIDSRKVPYYAIMVAGRMEIGPPLNDEQRLALATRYLGEEVGKRYVEMTAGNDSVSLRLKARKVMEFNGRAGR